MKPSTPNNIRNQNVFKDGNIHGLWLNEDVYAVCSYGAHWVLAAWLDRAGWFLNSTKYGKPTTNRHQRLIDAILGDRPHMMQHDLQGIRDGVPARPQPHIPNAMLFAPARDQLSLFDVNQ
jgi:hypothetical protein